jgi:hypothetical protein
MPVLFIRIKQTYVFAVLYYKVRSVWFILLIFYIVHPYKMLSKVMYFPALVLPSVSSVNT